MILKINGTLNFRRSGEMGCNCGKKNSGSDEDRASANLKKKQEERTKPPLNVPTFPIVPSMKSERYIGTEPTSAPENSKTETSPRKGPTWTRKVTNLGKAVVSRVVQGKADDKLIKLRVLSCHGDDEMVACPYRSASNTREGAYFCTACGCGDKPAAFLNDPDNSDTYTKLDYPWVSCPVRMPGFGDYKPSSEETQEEIDKVPEGMKRKKEVEVILTARGIAIPPAYKPVKTNGDTNDSSES
jgi:hypothetical protein